MDELLRCRVTQSRNWCLYTKTLDEYTSGCILPGNQKLLKTQRHTGDGCEELMTDVRGTYVSKLLLGKAEQLAAKLGKKANGICFITTHQEKEWVRLKESSTYQLSAVTLVKKMTMWHLSNLIKTVETVTSKV